MRDQVLRSTSMDQILPLLSDIVRRFSLSLLNPSDCPAGVVIDIHLEVEQLLFMSQTRVPHFPEDASRVVKIRTSSAFKAMAGRNPSTVVRQSQR